MLRVLSHSKRQRPKRQGPRTVQEAAEAFISHGKNMERELARALRNGEFDVSNVRDLENLVPVVESALEYASRAMEACESFYQGRVARLAKSQRGANKENNEDIDQNLQEEVDKMARRLKDYPSICMSFVVTLIGDTHDYHTQADGDKLKREINQKLFKGTRELGEALHYYSVVAAYTGTDEAIKRDKGTRLARFVCDCYKRLRNKVASLFEKYVRATMWYALYHLRRYGGYVEKIDFAELDRVVKERVRTVFRGVDSGFKNIGDNVRAMEMKTRIHDLVARYDTQNSNKAVNADELASRAERAAGAFGALASIAKNEVLPFFGYLVDQPDRPGHETQNLINGLKNFILESGERLLNQANAAIADMKRRKEEEARIAEEEEERAAKARTRDWGDEHDDEEQEDRVIRESKKKLDKAMSDLDKISERLNPDSSRYTNVFGSTSSSSSSSAFGRYVHRAAKSSLRVPPRAWRS